MTYIAKPKLHHPSLVKNKAGFTRRDYEGAVSTLCAGCGHDSISAAIVQACYELDVLPHLFEPFRRGTHARQGHGFGLYIVRCFVEALGGRVAAHSLAGEGTAVTVELPVSAPAR